MSDNGTAMRDELPEDIVAEAALWVIRLEAPDATAGDRAEFAAWRDADPRHARAYAEMTRVAVVSYATDPLPANVVRLSSRPVVERAARNWRPAAAAAVVLAAVAGFGAYEYQDTLLDTRYQTAAGEIRAVRLADGSEVTMNGGTRLRVRFTSARRALELEEGEALFAVAEDRDRPFQVRAGERIVQAVGTEFDVDRRGDWVGVAVSHGTVAVGAPAAMATAMLVNKGKATSYEQGRIPSAPRDIADADIAAWRRKELAYYRAPLGAVLDALGRHYGGRFEADPALLKRNVSLLMPLGDRTTAVALVAKLQSLRAVQVDATTTRFEDAARP